MEYLRDRAVQEVDARHGYTMEFSSDPEAHRREYDVRTQELIREARAVITQQRRRLQDQLEDLQMKARRLMRQCAHPDRFRYTVMGDPGVKCPDCGWAT